MKKLLLIAVIMIFLPMFLAAQDNAVQENIKNEVTNYLNKSSYSMQELNSTLLQEYGIQNIEFVKLENGKYIPVREDQLKKSDGNKGMETQISSDVILIFAIIGAVLVALILLRSL
jgi:hypothetical protein